MDDNQLADIVERAGQHFADIKQWPSTIVMDRAELKALADYAGVDIDDIVTNPQTKFHLEVNRIDWSKYQEPNPPTEHQKSYRSRWKKKAIALIDRRAEGKHFDRRENRLAEQYVIWRVRNDKD